jgi:Kef-type K+ transport system membrane component KefB
MGQLSPLLVLILQILVILAVCRAAGWVAARLRQPQVIGEMIAGILLGPSLLGWVAPQLHAALFPAQSLNALALVSKLGLILFMFVIGLEFQTGTIRRVARQAAAVSLSGIAVPFVLGSLTAMLIFQWPGFFPEDVAPLNAALFLGAAMSVTAFPVLARILREHRVLHTPLGTLALASASIDDVAVWVILAFVLALAGDSGHSIGFTLAGSVVFVTAMFVLVRPLCQRFMRQPQSVLPLAALGLFGSAAVAEWIGIHAIFGAFLFGMILPRGEISHALQERIEPVTVALFLPLFFAVSGMNTQIHQLGGVLQWLVVGLVFCVACLGKTLGCGIAAWRSGETPRDAVGIAALMNARGLMELVVLNLGLQYGLIAAPLFSAMVIMALVTTFIASPLFLASQRVNPVSRPPIGSSDAVPVVQGAD